jgi:hypothetical protein
MAWTCRNLGNGAGSSQSGHLDILDAGQGEDPGMTKLSLTVGIVMLGTSVAQAQVQLDSYADANGNIDVQKLTCAQLANTFQEDADFMTVWYSGWYNGLAKFNKMKIERAKELEHRVIVYCKANPDKKVITAMDILIKHWRKENGVKVKDDQ